VRVVIASRIYEPEPAAASFRLRALAVELAGDGTEVEVLTSRAPGDSTSSDHPGVTVRRARVLRDRDGYVRGYLPYLSFDVPLLFRLLFTRRPDVVVVEPPPTTGVVVRLVCALRGVPYVYYAADVWSDAAGNATSSRSVLRVVRAVERAAWKGAATVLSVSSGVTARVAELEPRGRIVEIGNGLEVGGFSPDGPVVQLDGPYVVYAGTASEVHGAGVFIDAFAELAALRPDARLVFIGQGADRVDLEAAAAALPTGSVHFLPRLPPEEVSRWLRGAVAALASVRPGVGYDFAFPTKLYAAVACGTPVIYAGPGPGRTFAADPLVGEAVEYESSAVADALTRAFADPPDAARRARLAAWARSSDRGPSPARAAAATVRRIVADRRPVRAPRA
jgi:glycosyltransferase involved in cell wall biosynthesis